MSHYFTNDNNLKSEIREIRYTFKGKQILFKTDSGIFSKDHIDFGSNVLINSVEDIGDNIKLLDVGCGYGTIGLTFAKGYPNIIVDLVDINERAVNLTELNKEFNNISNANAFVSNLYENVNGDYDIILSNPPIRAGKKVVFGVVEGGYNRLKTNGKIVVVIQKKQGAPSLLKMMEEVYGNVEVINKEKGYFIIQSIKK